MCLYFYFNPYDLQWLGSVAGVTRSSFLVLLCLFGEFGFVSKINTDFDFIDIHQNGRRTMVDPPTAQV